MRTTRVVAVPYPLQLAVLYVGPKRKQRREVLRLVDVSVDYVVDSHVRTVESRGRLQCHVARSHRRRLAHGQVVDLVTCSSVSQQQTIRLLPTNHIRFSNVYIDACSTGCTGHD